RARRRRSTGGETAVERQSLPVALGQYDRKPRASRYRHGGMQAIDSAQARIMNQADLQALRNPLITTLVVLLAGAAAIFYFDRLKKEAHQQLTQQQVQLKEARTRLQKSGEEKDIIV